VKTATLAPRLLLVEDEPSLALTLGDRLERERYVVETCGDGESALKAAERAPFDVLILDLMLPDMSGFDVCKELRKKGIDAPILVLTAKTQVPDKVTALKLGADDYLTKPFDMRELLARVEALLRRRRESGSVGEGVFSFGDVRVDFKRAEVLKGGAPVALSSMELRLLRCLVANRGEALTRDRLLDLVWGLPASPFSRTVDVHVASLRQKVEEVPSRPRFVVTVHGVGYRFDG
jgi:DNA-binding response OmpR family regulator